MTLYQVLHELQIVLALILGACPLCCQPVTLDRLAAALNLRRLINLGLTRTTEGTWALA